jgi:RNA polymerase sigma-70 factor (ECF subfamily)
MARYEAAYGRQAATDASREAIRPKLSPSGSGRVSETLDGLYRLESRRILATLIRLLGDFDLAEEALQEAFASALDRWPEIGIPENPRAWLISAGRFRAIDAVRRNVRFRNAGSEIGESMPDAESPPEFDEQDFPDDTLRLIFTCCHPALSLDARIAMTLREVCGLSTEEVAAAFLTPTPTIAQRIVRAKAKIRDAGIPYRVPTKDDLPDRLDAVLRVVYLVFSEGYAASSGATLVRADLSGEAIRLGRLLYGLASEPEVAGLLALMLLQESRRLARVSPTGSLILLEDQDRTRWNREFIEEGRALVREALASGRFGVYSLQAAIAAVHSEAVTASGTDWRQIVQIYDVLFQMHPSPVVELNRAVAVAMTDGAAVGAALVDALLARGELADYHHAYSTRAELCRRAGRIEDARSSYGRAIELARQTPERQHLVDRLSTL